MALLGLYGPNNATKRTAPPPPVLGISGYPPLTRPANGNIRTANVAASYAISIAYESPTVD